jgi:hypothetical protein
MTEDVDIMIQQEAWWTAPRTVLWGAIKHCPFNGHTSQGVRGTRRRRVFLCLRCQIKEAILAEKHEVTS